jgi:hypothetical protein
MLPVPADALRGLAMLVRGCTDSKTPTPLPVGPALAHPFTLMLPVLTAALIKGASSIQKVGQAVSAAVAPAQGRKEARASRDPAAPTTEVDLVPPGLVAHSVSTSLDRPLRRRRFASLLRIGSRAGLHLVFGGIWQRVRSIVAHRPRD